MVIGLVGKAGDGLQLSPWRRGVAFASGIFFIYNGAMYYLPKYRRQRQELEQLFDETEKELDEKDSRGDNSPKA